MRINNLPIGKQEFFVESLSVFRVIDKLARQGVEVCSFRFLTKNSAVFTVNGKDTKKVFAILRGSCYNIKKVRPKGALRVAAFLRRSIGFAAGILLFFISVLFFQARVLDIRVVGSGAYYRDEVMHILNAHGVKKLARLPGDCAPITASIIALPYVSFCTVGKEGGIVTVTVEVTSDEATLKSESLCAPATGVIEELVVVRGTPLYQVGDSVTMGDEVVKNQAVFSEEGISRQVIVIARVSVAYSFCKEYAGSEESALLSAELEFQSIREVHTTKTEAGWLVEGVALIAKSLNLG